MRETATKASWKTNPPPEDRQHFELPLLFNDDEGEKIRLGHVPKDMDDRWFIYFDQGWLYFHRSWTGDCIFGVRLDGSSAGARVVDAWASRDSKRYNSPGMEQEKDLVTELIRTRLLAEA